MAAKLLTFTKKQILRMVKKYKKGSTLAELSEEFSVSIPVIRRTLAKKRVKIRSRGHRGSTPR